MIEQAELDGSLGHRTESHVCSCPRQRGRSPEWSFDLVTCASAGCDQALGHLGSLSRPVALQATRRLLSDPADQDDATQDALAKVLTEVSTFRGQTGPSWNAWVSSVARNMALRTHRKWSQVSHPMPGLPAQSEQLGSTIATPFVHQELYKAAIMRLCTDQREVYCLREQGFGNAEIAKVLKVSLATVKRRLSEARINIDGYLSRSDSTQTCLSSDS